MKLVRMLIKYRLDIRMLRMYVMPTRSVRKRGHLMAESQQGLRGNQYCLLSNNPVMILCW